MDPKSAVGGPKLISRIEIVEMVLLINDNFKYIPWQTLRVMNSVEQWKSESITKLLTPTDSQTTWGTSANLVSVEDGGITV